MENSPLQQKKDELTREDAELFIDEAKLATLKGKGKKLEGKQKKLAEIEVKLTREEVEAKEREQAKAQRHDTESGKPNPANTPVLNTPITTSETSIETLESETIESDTDQNSSLKEQFLKLSAEYKIKKEAYDKEVAEREERIRLLEQEIRELEELEEREANKEQKAEVERIGKEIAEKKAREKEKRARAKETTQLKKEAKKEKKRQQKDVVKTESTSTLETQTQEVIERAQEETLVKSLSKKELKIVQEEMRKSTPLPFESKKTKTDMGIFLRNQVVKFVSGLKVPERMQKITRKMRKGVLLSTGILVLWSSSLNNENNASATSYSVLPMNTTENVSVISKDLLKKSIPEQLKKVIASPTLPTLSTYEQLPPSVRDIYLYATKSDSSFVIIDKPTATMYVVGKNGELMASCPVLLGKTKGETKNLADVDAEDPGPHATTPAGKYKLGHRRVAKSDYITYEGRILSIYGSDNLAIHMTYPGEYKKRTEALNTTTVEDNRMSWGCINVTKENFDKYLANIGNNSTLFITPDDESVTLNPETGKLDNAINVAYNNQLATSGEIKMAQNSN